MVSTIGLKIANGEFYSIVEENSEMKKRLILTTVHNNQQSVQIDLYKSSTRTMADALYIGSLVVENIRPRPKGDPSIELVITSSENGEVNADAVDLDASAKGEHQTLNVSLKSMEEDTREYEIPDFELEGNESASAGVYEKSSEIDGSAEKKKFPWLIIICAALILTAIALAVWFFLFKTGDSLGAAGDRIRQTIQGQETGTSDPASASAPAGTEPPASSPAQPVTPSEPPRAEAPAPSAEAQPSAPSPAARVTPPVVEPVRAPPPVIQAPARAPASVASASRERQSAPVASYNVPSTIPPEGVAYRIRYGDTLWDIAAAFYRNPWLYPRIARFNNIRNPDRIISGTTIRVPPRN